MAEITVRIELPEGRTYGEMMKGYLTLMRVFGVELGAVCSATLDAKHGNWWFQALVQKRLDEKKLRGQQQDLRDAMVVLEEIAYEQVSPIHEAFPPSHETVKGAKVIVAKRNELLHFSEEPSLEDIAEAARLIQLFARHYGLTTDGAIVPLLSRLQRIKRGQYVGGAPVKVEQQPGAAATETAPAPPADEPPAEVTVIAEMPRPKIGGVWQGDIPAGHYRVTKTGDLVSTVSGDSIRGDISGDADAKLRAWLAPNPKGDLWIAEDGAVGGYVAAVPRLLGYVGDEPPGEVARGFLLPRYFEVQGSVVSEFGGNKSYELPEVKETVVDGELLRLTTYGDLIRIDDDGVTRVAVVDPREWS